MIGWVIALALLGGLHLALPVWWWVMAVPFAWGVASHGSIRRGFGGGAALDHNKVNQHRRRLLRPRRA